MIYYLSLVGYLISVIILLPGEIIGFVLSLLKMETTDNTRIGRDIGRYIGYAERLLFSSLLLTIIFTCKSFEDAIRNYVELIKIFSLVIALKGLYRFGDKEKADRYILGSLLSLSLSVIFGFLFLILNYFECDL